MMISHVIVSIATAIFTGGFGVAWIKGKYGVKLKQMDQNAEEVRSLNTRFNDLLDKYMLIIEEHAALKGKSESQEHEIEMLKRKIKELSGYKNQQLKLNRLTRALNEFYKSNEQEKLVKALEKELL